MLTRGQADSGSSEAASTSSISTKRELPARRNKGEIPPSTTLFPVKIEELSTDEMDEPTQPHDVLPTRASVPTTGYQTSQATFASRGPIPILPEGMQSVPVPSVAMPGAPTPYPLPGIFHYHRGMVDGSTQQYTMPVEDMIVTGTTGDMSAYQLRNPSSGLPQGVAITAAHSSQQPVEDASLKRELRLLKNREAAKACRRRRKEYVRLLETRATFLEMQNQQLRAEVQRVHDLLGLNAEQDSRRCDL